MAHDDPLYMIRVHLRSDRLVQLGAHGRLPLRQLDTGYLVHAALRALFGRDAPQPFSMRPVQGRMLPVLGYGALPAEALRDQAAAFADPLAHAACDWRSFAGKPMPERFEAGRRLRFELRCCPVCRMASTGEHHAKGAEVDVFVARCWKSGSGVAVDRASVYREWLASALERQGGTRLVCADLRAFKRERLLRRTTTEPRKARAVERPDVTFTGEVEVHDPALFQQLLRSGVGRHRAFGFGMLLLKP